LRVRPGPNTSLSRSLPINPFPAVIGFTSIFTATMIEQHHLAPGLARPLALAAGAR
jgi:hypothetical protein